MIDQTILRRTVALFRFAIALGALAASLFGQAGVLDDLVFDPIGRPLLLPVAVTHAGDGSGRLFVSEQHGRIIVWDGDHFLPRPMLDISHKVGCCGERGFYAVAFHPDFSNNGFFFVSYIEGTREIIGKSVVSRFRVSPDDPNVADPSSEEVLFELEQPNGGHNAGQIQFGPDGMLYLSLGDGGLGGDDENFAQRLDVLFGKVLRLDVNGEAPYEIPPDNPFVGTPDARGEIWALGLRNPWRFSFDRVTGDMFIGDVGVSRREEINFLPATSSGGENYGWRTMEGSLCYTPFNGCDMAGLTLPIVEYDHGPGGDCDGSVSGGYSYRGADMPELEGIYLFGDYCHGWIFGARQTAGEWMLLGPKETGYTITAFGEDEAGELYVVDYLSGLVYRIKDRWPLPELSVVTPITVGAGGAGFTMTLGGENFVPASQVTWNGENLEVEYVGSARLQAHVPEELIAAAAPGTVRVFNPEPGGGLSAVFSTAVEPADSLAPSFNEGGLVGATGAARAATGSLATLYGIDLAITTESAAAAPLPTSLGGVSVLYNGELALPLLYASNGQINLQIPWEADGTVTFTPRVGSRVGQPIAVPLGGFEPGVYTLSQADPAQGAILIAGTGGAVAAPQGAFSSSRPARAGEILEVYASGLGPVEDAPPIGMPAPLLPRTTFVEPTATVGGVEARVLFSGLAPGLVGVYQVNVEIPADSPSGDSIEVRLTTAERSSEPVTVAIE